jgi:hypothetical protein
MVTTSSELKLEHEQIERELIELETIVNSSYINYPNLHHVLRKIKEIWDKHEEKEEIFFTGLYKKGFTIPVKKATFEHGHLKKAMDSLIKGFQSGSEDDMRNLLVNQGKKLLNEMRQHMSDEDWIFYALPKTIG